jgi:hypothetical protein
MTNHIYGEVDSIEDLRKIAAQIRLDMDNARDRAELTELKKRGDYLVTLTYSPAWQKKFGKRIEWLREVARAEDRRTTLRANRIAAAKDWDAEYHPWGGAKAA